MLTSRSQRWRDRRASYVGDTDVLDTNRHAVDVIEAHRARGFIAAHHYLPSYPAAKLAVGLFGPGKGGRAELVGVAVFGVPPTGAVITRHTGLGEADGCCLSRLILLDHVPGNAESWMVSRSFAALRREKPTMEAVVSYSDPRAGHIGSVYSALSGQYRGQGAPRTGYILHGQVVSGRSLSKVRLAERGAAGAVDQLVALGAPTPRSGQDLRDWIDQLLTERILRRYSHPGLHTYCFPLTRRARARSRSLPCRPYPKVLVLPRPELAFYPQCSGDE